jgi:hypothetical protein
MDILLIILVIWGIVGLVIFVISDKVNWLVANSNIYQNIFLAFILGPIIWVVGILTLGYFIYYWLALGIWNGICGIYKFLGKL